MFRRPSWMCFPQCHEEYPIYFFKLRCLHRSSDTNHIVRNSLEINIFTAAYTAPSKPGPVFVSRSSMFDHLFTRKEWKLRLRYVMKKPMILAACWAECLQMWASCRHSRSWSCFHCSLRRPRCIHILQIHLKNGYIWVSFSLQTYLFTCFFFSSLAAGPVHAWCPVPWVFQRHPRCFSLVSLLVSGACGKCLG